MCYKTYKIADLIEEIAMGPFGSNIKVECFVDEGVPVLNGSNLEGFALSEREFRYVTPEKAASLKKANASRGDVVITHRGTLGQIVYIPETSKFEQYVISQSQFRVRCNEKILPEYMVYYFHTAIGQHKLLSNASQVGVPALARPSSTFQQIEIDVPSIDVQRKIVAVLNTIQSKINCNSKINDNLYRLLMLSFKHDYWDVAGCQTTWTPTTLGEATSRFGTGLNPRKNFVLGHGSNYYVTIKNMRNNRIYLDEHCDMVDDDALIKIQKRSDLQVGDLLFSGIGTIGRVYLIDKPATNWNTSESVFNLRPNASVSSEFLYLLLLHNDMQEYAVNLASGSVQKGIRMADLKRYRFILPNIDDMQRLTALWSPLIRQIKSNEQESDRLAEIRDTLLPQLMAGKFEF